MSADVTITLPDDLRQEMEAAAQAEGKSVDELFAEAARRMLRVKRLRALVSQNRIHAESQGLTESDVSRLIAEHRAERSR
jgi:hypothetical protein